MSAGIDYGRGVVNINEATGIRCGVISMGDILQAWADSSEPVYPCANPLCTCEELRKIERDCYFCEPCGYEYEGQGYAMQDCLDSDVMVIESPFYTYARFCSPCAPGAGDLNNYDRNGVKTYCLDGSWFDSGVAPYPVYSVETDMEVK